MELEQIVRRLPKPKSVAAGSVIFREGESADVMYVVVEGQVKLTINGESMGMEVKGGIIGEMALIDLAQRSATAVAVTDCQLAPLDRDQFVAMLSEAPEFSLHVMSVLADRLRLANEILATV